MGKCDYCKLQKSNGECGYNILTEIKDRSHFCKKAIGKMRMKKCNFCTKSTQDGECDAEWDWDKEKYCEKAITRMMKAGGG